MKENELVKKYLRRYINGFKSNDIKELKKDCIKSELCHIAVFNKIVDASFECR